jgi:CDP-diacylglycerol--glycerol-3-phosphate 3-phosphatidyltransferase
VGSAVWRALKHLPNLLTLIRLALAPMVFLALAAAASVAPSHDHKYPLEAVLTLERAAFVGFVVAAVTDFFDGWLARRLGAVSVWGAILDPICDKALTLAAVLGLVALHRTTSIVIPGGLILFRELAVSGLRETVAAKGVSLPVTWLAKWKTTLQLVALGLEMLLVAWRAFALPLGVLMPLTLAADPLMWLAAIITLVTGAQYFAQAARALSSSGSPAAADRAAGG